MYLNLFPERGTGYWSQMFDIMLDGGQRSLVACKQGFVYRPAD